MMCLKSRRASGDSFTTRLGADIWIRLFASLDHLVGLPGDLLKQLRRQIESFTAVGLFPTDREERPKMLDPVAFVHQTECFTDQRTGVLEGAAFHSLLN